MLLNIKFIKKDYTHTYYISTIKYINDDGTWCTSAKRRFSFTI